MDFSGPYSEYGNVYILVIVDLYSRFVVARPVKGTAFSAIKGTLDDVFDTYGRVKTARMDNGPPFFGSDYKAYLEHLGTETTFSTPLDAQQNGGVERYMQLVNKAMSMPSLEGSNWRVA